MMVTAGGSCVEMSENKQAPTKETTKIKHLNSPAVAVNDKEYVIATNCPKLMLKPINQ